MPVTPLHIGGQSEKDLLTISEHARGVEDAYARLFAIKESVISPIALRREIADALPPGVARALLRLRQLIGLRAYVEHSKVSIPEAIESLSVGLKQKGWSPEVYQKWERISSIFGKILALDNIGTTAKALELSSDFEHVLLSTNILTDIRPVFSMDRTKIIGGIICSRLRLKYEDEDEDRSLSVCPETS
jgi:hypothetical protein